MVGRVTAMNEKKTLEFDEHIAVARLIFYQSVRWKEMNKYHAAQMSSVQLASIVFLNIRIAMVNTNSTSSPFLSLLPLLSPPAQMNNKSQINKAILPFL